MKKKKLFLIATAAVVVLFLTAAGIASTGDWVKVSDPCGRCKITKYEHTCGRCGSGMTSTTEWDSKMEYLVYTFKCKDREKIGCKHSCIYKIKP